MDAATGSMLFNVLCVVAVLAVTPWDYVWKRYATVRGEPWARRA